MKMSSSVQGIGSGKGGEVGCSQKRGGIYLSIITHPRHES